MTVTEYERKQEVEPGKYLVRVAKHKTAFRGPANIVFDTQTKECMQKYNALLRPQITPQSSAKHRNYFS